VLNHIAYASTDHSHRQGADSSKHEGKAVTGTVVTICMSFLMFSQARAKSA
jgi:hypothetical protein